MNSESKWHFNYDRSCVISYSYYCSPYQICGCDGEIVSWYPDAIRKPVTRFNPGGSKALKRIKGRGVCFHVAASEGASLFNYFNQSGNPCSHFYVRRDGTVEQYVDTDYRAPAQLQGNPTMLGIETQGGANESIVDTELWSVACLNSLIKLTQWLQQIDNFPAIMMANSISTSKGLGYHKLGINPWRVDTGELWSESNGKLCPGKAKINQIRTIILPGIKGENPDMATLESIEIKVDQLLASEAARYAVYTDRYNVESGRWEAEVNRDAAEAQIWAKEVERDMAMDAQLDRIETAVTNIDWRQVAINIAEQLQLNFPELNETVVTSIVENVINRTKLNVVAS